MDGTDEICCGMPVKNMGMLVTVRKIKALTVKMKTVTLTGKGRQYLTYFVY
jgi:hypothetical protein